MSTSPLSQFSFSDGDTWLGFETLPESLRFSCPTRILVASCLSEVLDVVNAAEAASLAGSHVVGMIAYEAAPAFASSMRVPNKNNYYESTKKTELPLAWFAVYSSAEVGPAPIPPTLCSLCINNAILMPHSSLAGPWDADTSRDEYNSAIERVRSLIKEGCVYQVNYTVRLQASSASIIPSQLVTPVLSASCSCGGGGSGGGGTSAAEAVFFRALLRAQNPGFGAYLNLGTSGRILSSSPELFFTWDRGTSELRTRPMKGTRPRGAYPAADAALRAELVGSAKEVAENLMIVDLLRNDVSRVAVKGSVHVPTLFAVEAFPTVWQMTSDIRAQIKSEFALRDVLSALFPCGSVTGAPKLAAMGVIADLERSPRGVYCGAILHLGPGVTGRVTASVPIRTLHVSPTGAVYGVGGGITWDSSPEGEWDEIWAKAAALLSAASACGEEQVGRVAVGERRDALQPLFSPPRPPAMLSVSTTFSLFETLRLSNGVYALREAHNERLRVTAEWLGFSYNKDAASQALLSVVQKIGSIGNWRVRLELNAYGVFTTTSAPLLEPFTDPECWLHRPNLLNDPPCHRILLLRHAVRSDDARLYSKTTDRRCYDEPRVAAINAWVENNGITTSSPRLPTDIFDVLFSNENDEITEMCIGNIIIEENMSGLLLTPPVTSGLLAGVLRNTLITEGVVIERVLKPQDIYSAKHIWLVNSLRGWVRVELVS
jgi:para-aminobenzoate synthetase/4-amino-4-deoxychorismate lyase